jgi:heme-degrading monooxygenase HmoA
MPVTEFAILPLTRSLTKDNSTLPEILIDKLRIAKTVLDQASKYKFHYFQQIEVPSIVYIIGRWDSSEAHYAFLPSAENQELLELFKEDIVMDGEDEGKKMQMWHLGNDVFAVASGTEWFFNAPVISCNRHFVPKKQKSGFIEQFNEVKGILEEFTKPYGVVGGWRIEKEAEEKEEWVLYLGFESVDNHMQFAKTRGFEKYREIVGFVGGFELKHLRAIKGL